MWTPLSFSHLCPHKHRAMLKSQRAIIVNIQIIKSIIYSFSPPSLSSFQTTPNKLSFFSTYLFTFIFNLLIFFSSYFLFLNKVYMAKHGFQRLKSFNILRKPMYNCQTRSILEQETPLKFLNYIHYDFFFMCHPNIHHQKPIILLWHQYPTFSCTGFEFYGEHNLKFFIT